MPFEILENILPADPEISLALFLDYLLSLWIKSSSVTIQMKATERYFSVMLFIMLYRVVLTFESVD